MSNGKESPSPTHSDLFSEEPIQDNSSYDMRQRRPVPRTSFGEARPPRAAKENTKPVKEWTKAIVFSLALVVAFTTFAWSRRTRHLQRKSANFGRIDKCDIATYPLWKIGELEELNLSTCEHVVLPDDTELWSRFKSLKKLDLNSNSLTELPDAMEVISPTLEILFLSENKFEVIPSVIGKLKHLRVLSLRGNFLKELSSTHLPSSIVWIILTNNQIAKIDSNIKDLRLLQKLMLSHNLITNVPAELGECKNLELVRLSNNNISVMSKEVLKLPKLAWVSLSGNPMVKTPTISDKVVKESDVQIEKSVILGKGASGIVYRGKYNDKEVAIKMFKDHIKGSDGNPEDELAINGLINHPLAMSAIGVIESKGQAGSYKGMIMDLLKGTNPLGKVPSFDTVTRDEGPTEYAKYLGTDEVLSIIWNVLSALEDIHSTLGVSHSDVYLHNILRDGKGVARLSDWGASWVYDRNDSDFAAMIERIEMLAFGRLVEDLFSWHNMSINLPGYVKVLLESISQPDQAGRPSFREVKEQLSLMPEFEKVIDSANMVDADQ